MRSAAHVATLALGATLLSACGGDRPPMGPAPALAVVARALEGEPALDTLAAGLALDVGHWLTRSPAVRVRTPSHQWTGRDQPFTVLAERLAVDAVVWLDVAGSVEQPVVTYRIEGVEPRTSAALGASPEALSSLTRRLAAEIHATVAGTPTNHESDAGWQIHSPSAYAEYLGALGRVYLGAVDGAGRVAMFERAASELGDYPPAVTELGNAYLDLAGVEGGIGPNYEKAEETLRRAVRLDPAYPPGRRLLASCFAKRGRSEESATLLLQGLATHPRYAGYHDYLGYVLRYAGLMEASIESYRRAQEQDGGLEAQVASQDQITKSLIYLGDYAAALASHQRMESLMVKLGGTPDEKEWFYRGVIHLYAGEREQALAAFRQAEELDATSLWTMFGRGYAGIASGNRAQVDAVLDALERRDLVDGERHYRLVHFAAALEEGERSLRHLRESIRGGFFNAPYIARDPLTAFLQTLPTFEAPLREAQARHAAFEALINKQ